MMKAKIETSEVTCSLCSMVLASPKDFKTHLFAEHRDKCFNCKFCSKSFMNSKKLQDHVKRSKFNCESCDKKFHLRRDLNSHIAQAHPSDLSKENKINAIPEKIKCPKCSYVFETLKLFRMHLKRHTPEVVICVVCREVFCQEYFYEEHLRQYMEGKDEILVWECEECSSKFHVKKDFNKHMESVHNSYFVEGDCKEELYPVSCSKCGRKFDDKNLLQNHQCQVVEDHLEKEILSCDKCDKTFALQTVKQIHTFLYHREKKDVHEEFPCDKCKKVFFDLSMLYKHLEVHQKKENTSYACPYCTSVLKSDSGFHHHLESHVKDLNLEDQDNLTCRICLKKFDSEKKLNKHIKTHNTRKMRIESKKREKAFVCDVCSKRFADNSKLKKHSLIHSAEKRLACGTCGKRFHEAGNLRKHQRIHDGTSKPHLCHLCSETFSRPINLKRHMEKKHNTEIPADN